MPLTMTLLNAGTARWGGSSLFYSVETRHHKKLSSRLPLKTTTKAPETARWPTEEQCEGELADVVTNCGAGWAGWEETRRRIHSRPHLSAQSPGCLAPLPLVPERESQTNYFARSLLSQVWNSEQACLGGHLTTNTCDLIVFASKIHKHFQGAETNASHVITANQETEERANHFKRTQLFKCTE